MRIYTGIDLGSTTTKAIIMTGEEEILGRGITNSRNNYDVACALAQSEAVTTARFALLQRAVVREPLLAAVAPVILPELERAFRHEQHERQLAALHGACIESADGANERDAVEKIFERMRREASARFAADGNDLAVKSHFFRDLATSQYLSLAEEIARTEKAPFDKLMGVFDKSIHRVENSPPDLSFETNIRSALPVALGRIPVADTKVAARLASIVSEITSQTLDEAGSVGTGYGRVRLPFPKERIRSEILCHGLGAHYFFPRTATVLDIGGQDTKAIQVDGEGLVTGFQMNDRCAAGCGRYLGYIAEEMNVGVHELGPIAQQSCRPTRIASTCTVFAGAELRERLSLGERREDILAGLHRAIILRAMSLLARSGGVRDEFTFTGGVARNGAALDALADLIAESYGDLTINISPDSIYTGAVGAALFARRSAEQAKAA